MATGLEPITRVNLSAGTGDVVGPASAVNNRIAVFNGTTGKLIADGGSTIADIVAGSGGLVTSVFTRTGAIVAATNDYTWAQINKATSSLADITTRSAGDLSSGLLLAARMPALTGDVVTTAGAVSTSITNDSVTLAKMADIATASFLGRNTAGTGDPEVLSIATAKTMLGLTGTNSGDVTLAGQNYLSIAGQVITANAVHLASTNVTGTLTVDKGGTGLASYAVGDLIYASAGTTLSKLADVATGNALISGGVVTPPSWGKIGLTTHISGTLGVTNGGTGTATQFTAGSVVFAGASGVYSQDNSNLFWDDSTNRLGILTSAPSQTLEVAGNVFINSATANLYMKDTSTGWQAASTTVITPQASNAIRSTSYTSGLIGWNVSALGNAEFNNVDVRGAIHASIFTYNAIAATAGTLGVFKSAGKLRSDVTIPAAPTYGTTTVNIDIVDAEGISHAASQLFAGNDIVRLKDGLVGDTWLKISAFSDQTTFWRYNAIIMAGTNNVTYRAGMGVPDYGPSNAGFIIQTADQTNSPYLQMATHASNFTSSDSSGSLIVTPRCRLGNLNGSYGYASDVYGFGTGEYGVASKAWVTVEQTNGIRMGSNTTARIHLNPDGSGFLANSSISWTTAGALTVAANATIAGWAVTSTQLSSGNVRVASGQNRPASGPYAWFGTGSTETFYGWELKDSGGRFVQALAGVSTNYPYISVFDATHTRLVIGGLNLAFESDGATASVGMKIWNAAGTKLVEFSDVQNIIAGWSISSTAITSGSGASTVALDTTVTGGDDIRIYAGSSTASSAPFRVTESGALTATNASIVSGSGNVTINSAGLQFTTGTSSSNAIRWLTSGNEDARLYTALQSAGVQRAQQFVVNENFTDGGGKEGIWSTTVYNKDGGGAIFTIVQASNSTASYAALGSIDFDATGGTYSPPTKFGLLIKRSAGATDGFVNAPETSAVLELRSTTGAFLLTRLTSTERDALTAVNGMVIYNTTTDKTQARAAGAWVDLH